MVEVSIIVVNYNTKNLTVECLASIVETIRDLSYEIIVVDNGSSDGSVEEIKKLKNINLPDGRVDHTYKSKLKIVVNRENLGFAKANNQGIKIAKGKYICLLNSDTKVSKDSIIKLIEFAKKTPDAGVIVPKLLNNDGTTQSSVFRLPTVIRAVKQYWFGERGLLDKYYPKNKEPSEIEAAVMAAFLITPEALKEVGILDGRYFMYYEDLDYCRRIKNALLKVYYLPSAEVIHHHGASGKKLVNPENQWRRLIPSSKIYHGVIKHGILNFIIWSGQKWERLFH